MTIAKGRCESEPMPRDSAAGSNPKLATSMVIMIGRSRRTDPSRAASSDRKPTRTKLVDILQQNHAGLNRYAEERQKADARGNAEVRMREQQG